AQRHTEPAAEHGRVEREFDRTGERQRAEVLVHRDVAPLFAGTVGLAMAATLCLALAFVAPLATTAIALMLFGVLHNVLELRYVGGRFAEVLSGTFLTLMVALITGIVGCRLLGAVPGGEWQLRTEIVISYAIVAAAAWFGLRRHLPAFLVVCAVLAVAATTSLSWPAYHVVVITHLHNLIPLAFLWEFSAGLAPAGCSARSRSAGWWWSRGWCRVVHEARIADLVECVGVARDRRRHEPADKVLVGRTPHARIETRRRFSGLSPPAAHRIETPGVPFLDASATPPAC
ncbi:MAG: hypothetical protein ACRD0H_19510, partial [Actinomycetes bacterium]